MSEKSISWSKVVKKASRDPKFRQDLLANPKDTLEKEYGVSLPTDVNFVVHEQSANTIHLVLPPLKPLPSSAHRIGDDDEEVQGGRIGDDDEEAGRRIGDDDEEQKARRIGDDDEEAGRRIGDDDEEQKARRIGDDDEEQVSGRIGDDDEELNALRIGDDDEELGRRIGDDDEELKS